MDADLRFNSLRAASLALLLTIGACSDDPAGPSGEPFDPVSSGEDFAAVNDALDANADLIDDLQHIAGALATTSTAAWALDGVSASLETPLTEPVATRRFAVASGEARPILPADLLGVTFEWDAAEDAYVQTDRDGAPTNGVRFIVYDRATAPLEETGHLDLTDESDASADRLEIELVENGLTRLSYGIELVETATTVRVGIAGHVTDGTDRIDFEFEESVGESDGDLLIELDYELSLAGQPLSVELDYTITIGGQATVELTTTFVNGSDTLVLDLAQSGDTELAGSVEWNGDVVGTITDDGSGEPRFLGADGEELAPAEAEALQEMLDTGLEALELLAAYLIYLGTSDA